MSINCDNTYIQVVIPGQVLNAKKYSGIYFRVGGVNCCYPLSPNAYSNTVYKSFPISQTQCCPSPLPPEPPQPCVDTTDLSGYTLRVSYAPSVCAGGHRCDRALFLCYINNIEVGTVNLNNGSTGDPVTDTVVIPQGIISENNGFNIELRGHPSLRSVHRGIARIEILDTSNNVIFDECAPDDSALFIPECEQQETVNNEQQNIQSLYAPYNLQQNYSGPVLGIRRSNDNEEQAFTAQEINNGTLESWVGSNNGGFIQTWYDQNSFTGIDLIQSDFSIQPKIVESGVLKQPLTITNPDPESGLSISTEPLVNPDCEATSTISYTKLIANTPYCPDSSTSGVNTAFNGSISDISAGYFNIQWQTIEPKILIMTTCNNFHNELNARYYTQAACSRSSITCAYAGGFSVPMGFSITELPIEELSNINQHLASATAPCASCAISVIGVEPSNL